MNIDAPGIFFDFPIDAYHRDPCPAPSLTQSVAKILLERSPLHAWHAHPRLNPDWQANDDSKFDVGNVAHKLMLGRGRGIEVIEAGDWRTKAAQLAREVAVKTGALPVLPHQFMRAQAMVGAARQQLELRGLGHFFREEGNSEIVLASNAGGIWLRQMIDWRERDRPVVVDYKTTGMSVAPHNLGRMLADAGWDIQAAMAERLLIDIGLGGNTRRRFIFVVQETEKPYCLSVVELSESVMTMGRKKMSVAMTIWRDCIRADRWPGYPTEIVVPEYPGWAESQWLDREQTEFAAPRADLIMAG